VNKKWVISSTGVSLTNTDYSELTNLQSTLGCPLPIARLLLQRDIKTPEEARKFFNPQLSHLNDPFLFDDMKKAVSRIKHAIEQQEKILIYGDYDVDGTTSTAILIMGLRELGAYVDFYIPDRLIDGYGLSSGGNRAIKSKKAKLVITVDCGISAIDEIQDLYESGIEVIVTDHHTPGKTLPNAYAILNPKVETSSYPYKELAGVGIAFKLLNALFYELAPQRIDRVYDYLDFVGLGTIADIVPLNGENRILAYFGIKKLEERGNLGFRLLLELAGLKSLKLKSSDVVFKLAPRINAAGRLSSAKKAVRLMITQEEKEAEKLALSIHAENQKRQQIDQQTFLEACEMLEAKYPDLEQTFFIVLAAEHWHPGVIGIVASKIVEKYNRPTILFTLSNGEKVGSGRSIYNFDLFECLSTLQDYLVTFGGHKYAAGLSILPEYLDIFEEQLNEYASKKLSLEDIQPQLHISQEINLSEANETLLDWLELFAPFGPQNMNPIFVSKDVMVVGYPYTVGTNHLKIKTMQNNAVLDLIGFQMGDFLPFLQKGTKVDIVYSLEKNEWQNISRIQGKLKDIRPHKSPEI
jgi:single-stranded-DNA-specific exonuclease